MSKSEAETNQSIQKALKRAAQYLRPTEEEKGHHEAIQAASEAFERADAALLDVLAVLVRADRPELADKVREKMRELDALARDVR